jgi:molybdopterin/thiamine biosynthesis adenylyltransferase
MENKFHQYLSKIENIADIKLIEVKDDDDSIKKYSFIYENEEFIVIFKKSFPGTLPEFKMVKPIKHPHVAQWGTVCINRIEDIEFDVDDIGGAIKKAFNSFFSVMKINPDDYDYSLEFADYVKYYKAYKSDFQGYIFQDFDYLLPHISKIFKYDKNIYITDSEVIDRSYLNINKTKITFIKALYIPLTSFFTIKEINSKLLICEVLNFVKDEDKKIILKLIKLVKTKNLIVSIKNKSGFYSYFYIQLQETLTSPNDSTEISSIFSVKNLNIEFLKARGCTKSHKQKILLVGLGSLGSEVLYHICKSGFDNIDICDFDKFEPVNIYRHFLGYNSSFVIYENEIQTLYKTTLLKDEMKGRYPSVNINAFNERIERIINEDKINLKDYDYIINATGNMVSNRFLNNYVYKNEIKTKFLYTWIEPYGVAMHIFINNSAKKGCLNCLLNTRNYVRLAKPGNYLIENDNCIGSFTKFGSIDVSRLAIEVVRELLVGNFSNSRHKVILGDTKEFLAEGHSLTSFSKLSEVELHKLGEDIIYEGCRICGRIGSK